MFENADLKNRIHLWSVIGIGLVMGEGVSSKSVKWSLLVNFRNFMCCETHFENFFNEYQLRAKLHVLNHTSDSKMALCYYFFSIAKTLVGSFYATQVINFICPSSVFSFYTRRWINVFDMRLKSSLKFSLWKVSQDKSLTSNIRNFHH